MKHKLHVTLRSLRQYGACSTGYGAVLEWHADRHIALDDDTKINILTLMQSNSLNDVFWAFRAIVADDCAHLREDIIMPLLECAYTRYAEYNRFPDESKRAWVRERLESFTNMPFDQLIRYPYEVYGDYMRDVMRKLLIDLLCNDNRKQQMLLLLGA